MHGSPDISRRRPIDEVSASTPNDWIKCRYFVANSRDRLLGRNALSHIGGRVGIYVGDAAWPAHSYGDGAQFYRTAVRR